MSSKRSIDELNDDDSKSDHTMKKRFVWPEALHRDFMHAIFSIGLKFCTAKKAHAILPSGSRYDVDAIDAYLQKLRKFNDNKLKLHKVLHLQQKKSIKFPPEIGELTSELTAINKSINAQLSLHEKFKATIAKQIAIRDNLRARLDRVKHIESNEVPQNLGIEATVSSENPAPNSPPENLDFSYHTSHFDELSSSVLKSTTLPASLTQPSHIRQDRAQHPREQQLRAAASPRRRSELSMLSAIRSHMNMHRELLDLNSKYASISSGTLHTQTNCHSDTAQPPQHRSGHQSSTASRPLTYSFPTPSSAGPSETSAPASHFNEASIAGIGKYGVVFGQREVDPSIGSAFLLGKTDHSTPESAANCTVSDAVVTKHGDSRQALDLVSAPCGQSGSVLSDRAGVQSNGEGDEFGDLFDFLF